MILPDKITCVECSGIAHRVGYLSPDEPPEPGESMPYLCEDCGHRMDVVLDDPDDLGDPADNA